MARGLLGCVPVAALVAAIAASIAGSATGKQPNIVLLITDDQDVQLGGTEYMPKLREYITEQGATMGNHFVNTPICCPSRSTLLSSRYYHNNRVYDPAQGGCMHMNTSEATNPAWEHDTFAPPLQAAGYVTGYFGKYLNQMPQICSENLVAPGWTRWMAMCTITYYNAVFMDQTKKIKLGKKPEDYSTSFMGNKSLEWVKNITADKDHPPFFVAIGPHAPHLPSTPAPWYQNAFGKQGLQAHHYGSWNYSGLDHHWLVSMQPILNKADVAGIDVEYTNRLRTLLSVDDIIGAMSEYLISIGEWDNTFFFYTSDHGYSLGQFRIPSHKTQVYDHNTRPPMLIKGPGVAPNSTITALTCMADLGATFIELAGGVVPPTMDGKSFASHLVTRGPNKGRFSRPAVPREEVIVEYESIRPNPTASVGKGTNYHPHDTANNTFRALRVINSTHNLLYAEFTDYRTDWNFTDLDFFELFDLGSDPFQLHNLYSALPAAARQAWHQRILRAWACKGADCP